MKKIINGVEYDTETAKKIGCYSNGSPDEFCYLCETLYQNETGEFFLHGDGNYGSKYSVKYEYGWRTERKIIPMTSEEAQQWVKEHLDENRRGILRRFLVENNAFSEVAFVDESGKAYIMYEGRFDKALTPEYLKTVDLSALDGCQTAEECDAQFANDGEDVCDFYDYIECAEEIIEF